MKTPLLLIGLIFTFLPCVAQSYLGAVLEYANLREGPGMEFESDEIMHPGESLFVFPIDSSKTFYNVVRIRTGKEGWINKRLVKITNELEKSKGTFFINQGKIMSDQCEAHIFNNTDHLLKIRMRSVTYTVAPHKRRTIQLAAGETEYYAYEAGLTPTSGEHIFEPGTKYEWQFYIGTDGGKATGWLPSKKKVNGRKRTL